MNKETCEHCGDAVPKDELRRWTWFAEDIGKPTMKQEMLCRDCYFKILGLTEMD